LSLEDSGGLYYRIGGSDRNHEAAKQVLSPIAPGIVTPVPIADWRLLPEGERVPVEPRFCTIALDGERSISVTPDNKVEIGISRSGPPVIQVDLVLEAAARLGLFDA